MAALVVLKVSSLSIPICPFWRIADPGPQVLDYDCGYLPRAFQTLLRSHLTLVETLTDAPCLSMGGPTPPILLWEHPQTRTCAPQQRKKVTRSPLTELVAPLSINNLMVLPIYLCNRTQYKSHLY